MNLYLLRHTRTALASGVCYGRLDAELAPQSDGDIERTVALVPRVSAIWTSPLKRCLALAQRLAARDRVTPIADDRLAELSFGQWEGKRWEDIDRAQSERWSRDYWDQAPPGGETARALHARVIALLAEIECSGHAAVAVVSHAGPIRAALCTALDVEARRLPQLQIDYGAVLRLARRVPCGASARVSSRST